jgi:hypothetical protein
MGNTPYGHSIIITELLTFFRWKWLKNVCFLAEVAEKRVFFWQKWLKNVRFLGRSV